MTADAELHGSERRLGRYRADWPAVLDAAIVADVGAEAELAWTYPGTALDRELDSHDFVERAAPQLGSAWREWWPTRGSQQMWDGIARVAPGGDWLLVEAKANEPEFVGSPCTASRHGGRSLIEKRLNGVKRKLGVHRHFSWLGSYYQFANRLAFLAFLLDHDVQARLVFVYFFGERFPDGCPCPQTRDDWAPMTEARRRTLGLPHDHKLRDHVHDVFLPAVPA